MLLGCYVSVSRAQELYIHLHAVYTEKTDSNYKPSNVKKRVSVFESNLLGIYMHTHATFSMKCLDFQAPAGMSTAHLYTYSSSSPQLATAANDPNISQVSSSKDQVQVLHIGALNLKCHKTRV